MNQFARNNVWELVSQPSPQSVIDTKYVFKNKVNGLRIIFRNKFMLVVKGFNQIQGIDYEEIFAPIAHLEGNRLLLIFSCYKGLKLF